MIIMSVDLGDARTGVAVCDQSETFAFPKGVIKEYNKDKLLAALAEKARELGAKLLVVGSAGFKAQECEALGKRLAEMCSLPLVLWDERCTTVSAHTALNYTDTRGKKRKEVVDAVAATIILEDYLKRRQQG